MSNGGVFAPRFDGESNNNNSSYQCCSLKQWLYQEDDNSKQDPGHILTSGANTQQHEPGLELHESSPIWPRTLFLKVTDIHTFFLNIIITEEEHNEQVAFAFQHDFFFFLLPCTDIRYMHKSFPVRPVQNLLDVM